MNLGRRANLNINSRQNCSRFSLKYSLDFSFCSPSAIVLPALHNFLRRQWNITKLSSSIYEFHFFTRKTRRETLPCGLFSLNVCEATRKARALQVASYNRLQRREFWAETHTPLCMAFDQTYHFCHTWKNIVHGADWTYHFFHVWKISLFPPLIGEKSFAYELFSE